MHMADPATPLISHTVSGMRRKKKGEDSTKREGKRKDRGKEEVCVNPASGLGSSRNPSSQPLTLRIERERGETRRRAHGEEEEEKEKRKKEERRRGAAKRPWQYPKRLSSR